MKKQHFLLTMVNLNIPDNLLVSKRFFDFSESIICYYERSHIESFVYIDVIMIFGEDEEQHLKNFRKRCQFLKKGKSIF